MPRPPSPKLASLLVAAAVLAGCASGPQVEPAPADVPRPADARAFIAAALPPTTPDRAGWATDLYAAFAVLDVPPTTENLCAAIAVTEQESGFRVDPAVPGLAKIAWEEIDRRAERAGVPKLVVRAALKLSSPTGKTYEERIDAARTEKELSRLFDDFVGMVPMGRRLFGGWNPVRTGGPMQVSIAYAEAHAADHPYPYPMTGSIRDEVFSRRGGLYFGIAHLLDYPVSYDRLLFRYADFNAGHYASRNAAFQHAVSVASGVPIALDGDLVRFGDDKTPGETELAVRALAPRLDLGPSTIRRTLEQGTGPDFDRSRLWERVFALAERVERAPLPRAVVPRIPLQSPKIRRPLTTEWFANRVDERHKRCMARGTPG